MGLQYNYGQQAADAEYKRNLQMWKDTNFGAQKAEMEKAGLSAGLMYGNGGGQAASTAGGNATQPNAPKTNPVEVALQQQSLGLQLKQIEAQNRLANAEATKTDNYQIKGNVVVYHCLKKFLLCISTASCLIFSSLSYADSQLPDL